MNKFVGAYAEYCNTVVITSVKTDFDLLYL